MVKEFVASESRFLRINPIPSSVFQGVYYFGKRVPKNSPHLPACSKEFITLASGFLRIPLPLYYRSQSGEYMCEVGNSIGKGRSQQIVLDVKCKYFLFLFSIFELLPPYISPVLLFCTCKKCYLFFILKSCHGSVIDFSTPPPLLPQRSNNVDKKQ